MKIKILAANIYTSEPTNLSYIGYPEEF